MKDAKAALDKIARDYGLVLVTVAFDDRSKKTQVFHCAPVEDQLDDGAEDRRAAIEVLKSEGK